MSDLVLFRLLLAVAILFGLFTGLGIFTFNYGNGISYFSESPEACINCHIMNDQYDAWTKGSHAHVAKCNDCHLPSDLVGKYRVKADNGFFHSWAFTFENFHEPIQIKPRNKRVVQDRCVECHAAFVDNILPVDPHASQMPCVYCHANVGHAATR